MVAETFAGIGAFKSMFDLARGLKDINDEKVRNEVAIELQQQILDAQAQQAALVERVDQLEKELARFETWDTEKQRYQLQELPPGVFVYALKSDEAQGEPSHRAMCKVLSGRQEVYFAE